MGWNDVNLLHDNKLFKELEDEARFYFLHSYYFDCHRKYDSIADTNYGGNFCCAVKNENIYGVQFHPEKSHHFGQKLLKNFSEI